MTNPNESVLVTEDGHPIGEVVLADSASCPPEPTEESAAASRAAALRAVAAELTGDPDADKAVAELYPGYGDADKRRLAMLAYTAEGKPIPAIAESVGVPERTVSRWAYDGQWDRLVRQELAAKEAQAKLELARIRAERRTKIVKEQLEQARELRDNALEKLRDGTSSVKPAAEAWAAAAKVEHTLTGLSEAGTVADVDGQQPDKKGGETKQTLVMVFQGGGLPPVRKARSEEVLEGATK